MFEKSKSHNTLLFTVVHVIFLIDASLESEVFKIVAECWALRPMADCIL